MKYEKGEINYKSEIAAIKNREATGETDAEKVNREKLIFENRIEREWLNTKEAAQFLSVSENALRIMVHRNHVPAFRFGRRLRFKLEDCRALFERKEA